MKTRYQHYRVRVAVTVLDNGDELFDREEWFHDPQPDYQGLKLHREFHPAVTVYDPDTGAVTYTEDYEMGERVGRSTNPKIVEDASAPSFDRD